MNQSISDPSNLPGPLWRRVARCERDNRRRRWQLSISAAVDPLRRCQSPVGLHEGGTVHSPAFKNKKLVLWNETWNYDLTGRVQQYESPRLILISPGVFYHWNCSQAPFCRELQAEAGDWRGAPGTPIRCWLTHCWLVDFPGARSLF